MKKTLVTLLRPLPFVLIVLALGCKKKDKDPSPMDCAGSAARFSETLSAYASNPTKANCEAYKNAVRSYINTCVALYTPAQKEDFEEDLAEVCTN